MIYYSIPIGRSIETKLWAGATHKHGSISDGRQRFFLLQSGHTSSVFHASFYSVGNGDAFLGSQAADKRRCYQSMEPYLHSHTRFHGV